MAKPLSTDEFILRARAVHGERYNYENVKYVNLTTKVEIVCSTHGSFWQTPSGHFKYGCWKCSVEYRADKCRRTKEEFIQQSQSIHGNTYDYSLVDYVNDSTKVKLICPVHGEFLISPTNHLYGKQGCRSCNMSASLQQDKWLDKLQIPLDFRNKRVTMRDGSYILADAVDHENKTVYEYWGDYWHGNPTKYSSDYINPHCKVTMGELFNRTQQKRSLIKESGYNLIEIWESEFMRKG